MLDHAAGTGKHTNEARGDDCYETPVCAVEALLRVENLPRYIWEPACGPGAIVRVLEAKRYTVFASDIVDYGWKHSICDFLKSRSSFPSIVTNPPYQLAAQFVRHALEIDCPYVAMLLRLAFLESEGRSDILENAGLARIHVFRNRLPMMHRRGWDGPRASSATAFAWYVWLHGYEGPTIIDRISWE